MGHAHHHSHNHPSHNHSTSSGLRTAFWLNAFFTIFEFIGGYFANSVSIMTDAVHDLGDCIAIGMGVILEKYSSKKADNKYTLGYKRFSLLSAVVLSTFLITGSILMIIHAIQRFSESQDVKSSWMFYLAIVGIIINGIGFLKLKKENQNQQHHNSKAVMMHLLEDVLGWIAILVGSIIIYFTNWSWIDPLLSIFIALFILYQTIPNLIETSRIFLLINPKYPEIERIKQQLLQLDGINQIEKMEIWTLDGNSNICNLNLVTNIENCNSQDQLKDQVRIILKKEGISISTIELSHNL